MYMDPIRRELLTVIANNTKYGDFTLHSGAKSTLYIDMDRVMLSPQGNFLCSTMLMDTIIHMYPNVAQIGGKAMGGVPLLTGVLQKMYAMPRYHYVRGFYLRNTDNPAKNKLEGEIHNVPTVIVEDVMTTGSSVLETITHVENAGGTVSGIVTVVDRRVKKGPLRYPDSVGDYPVDSLFTETDVAEV